MGDRISISFSVTHNLNSNGQSWKQESATLSSHWQGTNLIKMALDFVENLQDAQASEQTNGFNPLDRLEPDIVMLNFIRMIPSDTEYDKMGSYGMISSDYRIVKDESHTDNSDNGHYEIDLTDCLKENGKPTVLQGNFPIGYAIGKMQT